MSETITITQTDVIRQVNLACLLPTVTEGLLTRKIIARTAEARGIEVEVNELQQAADKLRVAHGLLNARDTWLWLHQHGLTLDDFEEIVNMTVMSSKLAEQLFADKVELFYIDHQLDYSRAVMYEVVLEDEDLALELFYALAEDDISFHEVTQQYIQDQELRRMGGYRGALSRADLRPEIAAAVFGSTPPQLLKPIITAKGIHLIFVEEVLRLELDKTVRSKIISDLFAEWLKQQIQQTEVSLAPDLISQQAQPSPVMV
jgi:hypothetical protein